MKKLTKFAMTTIIIQTILTLGINWLFFLIYYRLNYYSFLATNKKYYEVSHFDMFFKRRVNRLSIISIISYFIFLCVFSMALFISNDVHFFNIINFQLGLYITNNIFYSIIMAFVIFILLTFSYKILIKNVYYTIYKKHHQYFNNFSELDLVLFIIVCILTLGWFYLLYLFTLGLYDLYIYFINKQVNKSNHYMSTFGIISLFLIVFVNIILFYYIYTYFHYYSLIAIYVLMVFIANTILNYGLFELKIRLFLDNNLTVLKKNQDVFKPYINKKIIYLCSFIIVISLFYSVYKINSYKVYPENTYEMISLKNLTCNLYGDNSICLNLNNNLEKKYHVWKTPKSINEDYRYHQRLIVSPIHPIDIDEEPIQTRHNFKDLFYTSPRKFYSFQNSYLYVKTYYKRVHEHYIPVFNIVKNLELVSEISDNDIYLSILNNDVYLYDFVYDDFSIYDRNYQYIDTTRLMLDHLQINIESNDVDLYGYHLENKTTYIDIKSNNIEKLKYLVSYFDPFQFNELIIHLSQSFKPLNRDVRYHLTDTQLLTFRLFRDTKHLSFYNDRFYLYMVNIANIKHTTSMSYINDENNNLVECPDKKCINETTKVLTHHLDIRNINKQSQILYTEANDTDYQVSDKKTISIYKEGKYDFSGQIVFSFDIKTINQYFTGQKISHQTLTISE